jgi:hypothetical protein
MVEHSSHLGLQEKRLLHHDAVGLFTHAVEKGIICCVNREEELKKGVLSSPLSLRAACWLDRAFAFTVRLTQQKEDRSLQEKLKTCRVNCKCLRDVSKSIWQPDLVI